MKYFIAAFLFSSVYFFSACQSTRSGPPAFDRQQFTFAGATRCDTTSNTGISVSVSYVLLKEDSEGARKINDSLHLLAVGSIVNWLDSTTVAQTPDARTNLDKAAALFATDYEEVRKDMGALNGCWELETTADTLHVSPKTLTVKFETYAYTGGAHPNSNLTYYTFDRETGRRLTLTDIVSDTTALLGVVEKAFRKQQSIQPKDNLEEQGYFLHEGRFFLPENIGLNQNGMVFYYNPYEIAAYSVGAIQITVPYEQLNGILHNDWL
ncbi:hypothetical protein GCM10028807_38250 [Spirosoma daeguense]